MTLILDGRIARKSLAVALQEKIATLKVKPKLSILLVGENPESAVYVGQKQKFGKSIGVEVDVVRFQSGVNQEEIIAKIHNLNDDSSVHGIILQLPLPEHLNQEEIIEIINHIKDVDGLTSKNVKKIWINSNDGHKPATARGVMSLLKFYDIDSEGKKVVIIGRSTLVGKPLAHLFLAKNATVTICHSHTFNLEKETKNADIIVVATGKSNLITDTFVSPHHIIIDVGINIINTNAVEVSSGNKFAGDVDFVNVSKIVSAITPVPGGVGPMTVLSLFENLVDGYLLNNYN